MGRVKAEMAHTMHTPEKRHRAPRKDALMRTYKHIIQAPVNAAMQHTHAMVCSELRNMTWVEDFKQLKDLMTARQSVQ